MQLSITKEENPMLGQIIKFAALGAVGYGAKKLYDAFQEDQQKEEQAKNAQDEMPKPQTEPEEKSEEKKAEEELEPMMKFIQEANRDSYKNEAFYQKLKDKLPKETKHWTDEQKNEFMREMLSKMEGMDGWYFISAEHPLCIFELSKVGSTTLDCLRLAADTFPNLEQSERIYNILKRVEYRKERQRNPIYTTKKMPEIGFKDVGFKLAIIHQLMFNEEKLTPKFDMVEFANESQCFIDAIGANREATHYLLNLDIPKTLLDGIEKLEIGNFPFYQHIYFPVAPMFMVKDFCQGYYVPISDNAVKYFSDGFNSKRDLNLLPNLKEVIIHGEYELIDDFKKLEEAILLREGNGFPKEYAAPCYDYPLLCKANKGEPIYLSPCGNKTPISKAFVEELKNRGIKVTFAPHK